MPNLHPQTSPVKLSLMHGVGRIINSNSSSKMKSDKKPSRFGGGWRSSRESNVTKTVSLEGGSEEINHDNDDVDDHWCDPLRMRQLAILIPLVKAFELDSRHERAADAAAVVGASASIGSNSMIPGYVPDTETYLAPAADGYAGAHVEREEEKTARLVQAAARVWAMLPTPWRMVCVYFGDDANGG